MQLMEDGSALGHPHSFLHSSKARQEATHCPPPPPPPLLHPTWKQATTHTPVSCVKKRIYSARTQYSIATKATIISLENQQTTNFKTTTKTSQILPTLEH